MKKPQIEKIIPHFVYNENSNSLSDRIAEFHIQIIEHKINELDLTIDQKLMVIDRIIDITKSKVQSII